MLVVGCVAYGDTSVWYCCCWMRVGVRWWLRVEYVLEGGECRCVLGMVMLVVLIVECWSAIVVGWWLRMG